jgi:DNA polymerase-1
MAVIKRWEKELDKPVVELMNRAVVMFSCQTAVGTTINLQALDTLAIDGKKLEQDLKAGLIEKYGCDPGQTDTLASRLRTMGYPLNRQTKTGKDALTKEALNELGLYDIIEWRQAQKLDSSFVGKIKSLIRSDGRLPHHQKVMEAKTGRTSMSDFNWQQAGRKGPTKGLLISQFPGGIIGSVDLAQAELRVACLLSGDLDMMEWLLMTDAHRFNAAMAFGVKFEDVTDEQRTDAKTVVFRLIYGGSAITDGQKIVEKYLRSRFKKFFQWFERTRKEAMSECEITDYFGKTCGLAQILDWRGKWAVGRAGVNSPIQGLASHIAIHITVKIWELFREYGLQSLVLFGVHDSIVMDIHPEEKDIVVSIVKQAFRSVMDTLIGQLALAKRLPISGELQFGSSWADTKNGDKILCSSLEVV